MATTKQEVKVGNFVCLTRKEGEEPLQRELASRLWKGGTVKNIDENGVAEVEVTDVIKVHTSKLTLATSDDAYDPIL